MKRNIKELTLEELKEVLASWKEPAFRAGQIFSWIYQKGANAFVQMSNLPQGLRQRLEENFSLFSLELAVSQESTDKTKKFLFKLFDDKYIEAVTIPAEKRMTGCISSQAGCKFACVFLRQRSFGI